MSLAPAPVFQALVVPHRSLGRKGVVTAVGTVSALSAAVAVRFWILGAWPVVAFSLFEIPLFVVLLAINFRRARASELIMLNEHELTVIRTDPAGRRDQLSLPSGWLRVSLAEAGGVPRIVLNSQGQSHEVGAFLHEQAKLSLFEALSDALHRARSPNFDNPQLR